jgi:hypothetical protein
MKKTFLALFLLAIGSVPSQATLTGWYKFDDSTNLGLDSSGQGKNASVRDVNGGAPTYSASGYDGGSAMFNGSANGSSSGGLLSLPINVNPAVVPNMTWGLWVKPSALTVSTAGSQVRDILSIDDGIWDRALAVDQRWAGNAPSYAAWNGVWAQSLGAPVTTNWTFLAAVYENNNSYGGLSGKLSVYVNGSLQATFGTSYGNSSANFIALGANPGWQSSPVEMFNGQMDNVFVYTGALSSSTISQLAAAGNPGALAIPEPSTYALVGLGTFALIGAYRRRHKSATGEQIAVGTAWVD